MTNNAVDYKMGNGTTKDKNTFYSARLTNNNQKGNIWCRYNNVGTYNGDVIDLKVTLSGWTYLQPANTSASNVIGGVNYPTVFFNKKEINVQITTAPAIDSPVFTYSFYKHGTNTLVSLKCHETFVDLDSGEYFIPTSGFDKVYRNTTSNLTTFSTSKIGSKYGVSTDSNADRKHWATCLISGSSFKFTYTRLQDVKGNSYRDITTKVSATSRSIYGYAITSNSLSPFTFPDISKNVNKEEVFNEEEFYYTISQYIPAEDSNFYYDTYVITDILAPCLEITGDIEIIDELSQDKTSMFDIKIENTEENWLSGMLPDVASECRKEKKKVTIQAKTNTLKSASFYNNNYYFKIPVKKIKDYDMKIYYTSRLLGGKNTCKIHNTAKCNESRNNSNLSGFTSNNSIGILSGDKISTVSVDVCGKIKTEVVNGTIDEGNEKLPLGSSQTIKYTPNEGYRLKSVTVNGEDVDTAKYPTEYTIDNLIENCDIKVVYEPIELPKGSITVNKQGTNNIPLQNVIFELYDTDNNLIDTKTTNENGQILFEELSYGKYILVETKTVPGYELNKDKIVLEISSENKDVEITVHNNHRIELPFAGGKGSIFFIIVGSGLMILSIITIIVEKKKNKKK